MKFADNGLQPCLSNKDKLKHISLCYLFDNLIGKCFKLRNYDNPAWIKLQQKPKNDNIHQMD